MNKISFSSISLLSALVLTACSGGGGSGGNHTPQAQMPKVNHQQPKVNLEQAPQAKTEEKVQPKVEGKSQPKAEEKPQPNVENKSQPKAEEKLQPNVENKSQPKAEEKPQPNVENKSQPKAEEKPQPNVENKSQPKAEEKLQPKVEDKSQPKAEEKPQPNVENKSQPKAEEKPQPNVEGKSQPKTEEKLQPKVEENSQPKAEEQLEPKVENEKHSMENNPKEPMSDADYFKKLNQFGTDYAGFRLVALNLEGKEITLSPVQNNSHINRHAVEILRDNSGKLFGYYGYASVMEESPRYPGSDELIAKHSFVSLLDIDPNMKAIEPTQNLKYYGKMYYHYVDVPAQVLGANVVADYNHQDKRFAMLITDDQTTWELRAVPSQKYVILDSEINDRENIAGRLYVDNKPKGEFVGGIYGSQGEILVGKANSTAEQGSEAWKGVVGAKAKSDNE